MRVDKLVVYLPDEMKMFATEASDDFYGEIVGEAGVNFGGDGVHLPYVRDKGDLSVFVGVPFY
jgi:hypothetical protein